MHVRILKDRRLFLARQQIVAFRQGQEVTVKRAWGEALVADGCAVEIAVPPSPKA